MSSICSARLPSLWPYLLLSAAGALWIDLGPFHRFHHSDSLVPVLLSVYHWTYSFWDSNHPGMLVPLLATPFKNVFVNLIVQTWINAGLGLSAFFLLARYILRDASYPAAALAGIAGFLAFAPPHYVFDFLTSSHYGTWLALGLGALVALEPDADGRINRWRRLVGLVLFLMAHWVYAATSILLGPLVVFRWLLETAPSAELASLRGRVVRFLIGHPGVALRQMAISTAAGLALLHYTPSTHHIEIGAIPLAEWPAGCWRFLTNVWNELTGRHVGFAYDVGPRQRLWPHFLTGAMALGLLLNLVPRARSRVGGTALAATLLAVATNVLYMGSRSYIAALGHFYRYLEPAMFLLQGAALAFAFAPLRAVLSPKAMQRLRLVLVTACGGALAVSFGWPSASAVRADLDQSLGADTEAVLAGRATHVIGDYWRVWPAVYHANLVLQERGEKRTVYGLTGNSRATVHLWRRMPRSSMRVALAAVGPAQVDPWLDPQLHFFCDRFRLPSLNQAERIGGIWVLSSDVAALSSASDSSLARPVPADYDGDGQTDPAVFWSRTGEWEIQASRNSRWTVSALPGHSLRAVPVPADYDGDGRADPATFDPSTGSWEVLGTRDGTRSLILGNGPTGTVFPVPADYDGDGRADPAVFWPRSGEWEVLGSREGRWTIPAPTDFSPNAIAVPADYDGDGQTDPASYEFATARWRIPFSSGGERLVILGWANVDLPAPGDYDGDGQTDLAVFRPMSSLLQAALSSGGALQMGLGAPGRDQPVPADYDGDGKTDPAVYQPLEGRWLIRPTSPSTPPRVVNLGRDPETRIR